MNSWKAKAIHEIAELVENHPELEELVLNAQRHATKLDILNVAIAFYCFGQQKGRIDAKTQIDDLVKQNEGIFG